MYHHLHASQDGTILSASRSALTAPVEGEALITATAISPAERAAGAELDEAAVLDRTLLTDLPAVDALQTVRPNECPPCPPPQVVYRDRTITKQVPVPGPTQYVDRPGPTQYVYVSPATGTPIGFASYDDWWRTLGREAGIPYNPSGSAAGRPGGDVSESPEQEGVHAGPGFPWWLLVAAAAGVYWYAHRKQR